MAKMRELDAVKMNSTFLLTMMDQMIFYFLIQELITIVVRVRGTQTATVWVCYVYFFLFLVCRVDASRFLLVLFLCRNRHE